MFKSTRLGRWQWVLAAIRPESQSLPNCYTIVPLVSFGVALWQRAFPEGPTIVRVDRLIVIAAAAVVASCAPPTDRQEYRLGTAALGGAYYPLGQGLASLVTRYADGISMVPIVTRGALENPRLVDAGELEMALTNADLAYFAYRGEGPFEAPLDVLAGRRAASQRIAPGCKGPRQCRDVRRVARQTAGDRAGRGAYRHAHGTCSFSPTG